MGQFKIIVYPNGNIEASNGTAWANLIGGVDGLSVEPKWWEGNKSFATYDQAIDHVRMKSGVTAIDDRRTTDTKKLCERIGK